MEILNTTAKYGIALWAAIVITVFIVVAAILVIFVVRNYDDWGREVVVNRAFFCAISLAIMALLLAFLAREKHTMIEAWVSDEAVLDDFRSQYDVIEVRGKIYVLEEHR